MVHTVPYLRHMVAEGLDVHWLQIAPGEHQVPGVTVHRCYGRGSYRTLFSKLAYFASGIKARKLLRRIAPDVVNAHYASSGGLVAWLSGYRPYAVTVHGSDLIDRSRSAAGRVLLRRILGQADMVNPVCLHMTKALSELGIRPAKVLVKTFGIDLERFPYRPRQDRFSAGLRLICTRSLASEVYDIPTIIRAIAGLHDRGVDVRLTLAASGRLQGQLESLTRDLGVEKLVEFRGGYKPTELPQLLSEHDVYVSSSLWDGASLSLMEAMACGAFPVVSDIPANREWLQDGKTSLLFPTGDSQRLADILAGLNEREDEVNEAVLINRQIAERRADRAANLAEFTARLVALADRRD